MFHFTIICRGQYLLFIFFIKENSIIMTFYESFQGFNQTEGIVWLILIQYIDST